ncbi:MAG: tetratricopeptide repeat protein [Candidatus Eisenbacteria bacterium]
MKSMLNLAPMRLVFDPWVAATQELEAERDVHPRFADQRNLLGLLYLERGQAEAALAEFEAALEVNPDYVAAGLNRLVALRRIEGSLDNAVWTREAHLDRLPEPQRSLWTAWYLAQRGDVQGMKLALRGLIEEGKWGGLAEFVCGAHCLALGDPAGANEAFHRAAGAHPLYRELLEQRGLLSRGGAKNPLATHGGSTDGPEGAWNPSVYQLDEFLGTLSARNGAFDQAEAWFQNAFLRQGDESAHQVRLARLCLARGDEEEAVQVLRRAIELDPTSLEARIALGFEYQSQGYQSEAVAQFEVAVRLQPSYPDLQYNLGLLYEAQERDSDAIRCYRRALEQNGGYFPVRTSLARLLAIGGQFGEALTELDSILASGLRSADLLVQRAECLLAQKQMPEAISTLEKAAALNPAFPRTYYVLGQAYRASGLKRKAQEAWRNYLETTRAWQDGKPFVEGQGRKAG